MAQIRRLPGVLPSQKIGKEPKRLNRSFFVLMLLVALIGFVYWFIYRSPIFAVRSVEITGTSNDAIRSITDRLQGENIFRIRTAQLNQELRQVYPPLASAEIVRGLPNTVRISISLRTPVLKWESGGGVYILDSIGEAFEQGDKEIYAQLPKVTDYSNIQVTVGKRVVTPGFIQFVKETDEQAIALFGKKSTAYQIHETIFHVDVMLEGDVRLRLTTQRPIDEQLRAASSIFIAHSNTRHIDVRVPGRGYYK